MLGFNVCVTEDVKKLTNEELKECINNLLYRPYKELNAKDNELMTIIIEKSKQNKFDFLEGDTSWQTVGRWLDPDTNKVLKENNVQLDIQFRDNEKEEVGKRLMELFKELNRREIKEKVLLVRTIPIEETTLW